MTIKRALISVSDKTDLDVFAKGLDALGVELISTSGTAKFMKDLGLKVRDISDLTNFPEILDGRVKTLHPHVHGGILYRRDQKEHCDVVEKMGIEPIDMVVVNLYPFREAAAKANNSFDQNVIENIDIGGPSMVRSAAKNFKDVAIICRPQDYSAVLKEMQENNSSLSFETKKRLMLEAFTHTAEYDAAISEEFKKGLGLEFPESKIIVLNKIQDLRYGENPHQKAALYSQDKQFAFEQLHGKELSYNNILDAFGTWDAVYDFDVPACVVFKHVTPCGVGSGKTLEEAFNNAWACDPLSAFGGIIAVNRPLDAGIANQISKVFIEAVCAPEYSEEALEILKQKKNIRILKRTAELGKKMWLKSVGNEVLMQEPDRILLQDKWECVTARKPTAEEETALKFAWAAVKHVKSNAIILTSENASVGIGAGQMSRVDSVFIAGKKYQTYLENNEKPKVLVLGSDAFFPFRDGIDLAAKQGITAIVQPGGSMRDEEAITACNEHNIAMIFTGLRHFRH
ncbi:phosphoribosylaminoimidazolecarboxamide formyltransferase/IMP cyclohydrolase [Elusimicrobium posterum]|uniref:bifunctional phosphoribosylaminoimidazolecarboxamide formyltransferase/IMP cyclohydrolase n=1 Tax=Elusimicrobium posterum TaxID=3116653 RepID=UPI003C78C2E2